MAMPQPQPGGRRESKPQDDLKLSCMSNLLSAAGERVYFKDRLSRFLLVSAGWIAAYAPGRAAEELIGKTDFDIFGREHATTAFEDEQQIIRTGQPIVGKAERESRDGRPDAWVSTTKMPLRDDGGQIIGTFGISRDVTAQVEAEDALTRQAQQLSTQNERLRELDGLKDDFLGLVSHELRTPLTSIIGYARLLRDQRTSNLNTDQFAEVIQKNAHRLLRLVEDLLFLSQNQPGELPVELRSADLADIAASVVEEMRPEARRKHIDLAFTAAAVPRLAVDPARMAQLLGNLISNAVKFTPDGGRVEVSLGMDEDQAVLSVADTGVGIPAADQEHIFERFFRTATATRQVIPGTGLGLAIAKDIVDAHHGAIAVDSAEGRGSTFRIRIPRQAQPGTAVTSEAT
jgi:two-component system, sensor histidine kinase and response regulator